MTSYSYESKRNLKTQVLNKYGANVISQYDYVYNQVGNRTSVENSGEAFVDPAFNIYVYNSRKELIESSRYSGTDINDTSQPVAQEYRDYSYDPIGNRQESVQGKGAGEETANSLNQYTQTTIAGNGSSGFTYDLDGNLTSISDGQSVTIFTWNAENRLIAVAPETPISGSKKLEFIYDYMGRRVKKNVLVYDSGTWVQDTSHIFFWEGWNVYRELITPMGEGQPKSNFYVWGLDLSQSLQGAGGVGGLLALVENSGTPTPTTHFFAFDANGNVGQLIDTASGSVDARYEYDPFGNLNLADGELANINPFRFSTKYQDNETSLYYYGYRYYSSELGRWLNRDPIGERGGKNLYRFVGNNSVNQKDILGWFYRSDLRIKTGDPWGKGGVPKVSFSCRCGWLDWSHMNPKGQKDLLKQFKQPSQQPQRNNFPFYTVTYGQESKQWGLVGPEVSNDYLVHYGLSQTQIYEVALAIVMETSYDFELAQGNWSFAGWTPERLKNTSFSEEDYISNLISLYRAVDGTKYSVSEIKRLCDVKSPEESERVYDRLSKRGWTPGKNKQWTPIDYSKEIACCNPDLKFPAEFQTIKPAIPGKDVFFRKPGPNSILSELINEINSMSNSEFYDYLKEGFSGMPSFP